LNTKATLGILKAAPISPGLFACDLGRRGCVFLRSPPPPPPPRGNKETTFSLSFPPPPLFLNLPKFYHRDLRHDFSAPPPPFPVLSTRFFLGFRLKVFRPRVEHPVSEKQDMPPPRDLFPPLYAAHFSRRIGCLFFLRVPVLSDPFPFLRSESPNRRFSFLRYLKTFILFFHSFRSSHSLRPAVLLEQKMPPQICSTSSRPIPSSLAAAESLIQRQFLIFFPFPLRPPGQCFRLPFHGAWHYDFPGTAMAPFRPGPTPWQASILQAAPLIARYIPGYIICD